MYRNDADAAFHRAEALEQELEQTKRERDSATQELERANQQLARVREEAAIAEPEHSEIDECRVHPEIDTEEPHTTPAADDSEPAYALASTVLVLCAIVLAYALYHS